MDNKAQISMELLIIMAALLAAAVVFITSLRASSDAADTKLDSANKNAIKEIGKIK